MKPAQPKAAQILAGVNALLLRRMGCLDGLSFNDVNTWAGGPFRSTFVPNGASCTFRLDLWESQRRNQFRVSVKISVQAAVVKPGDSVNESWHVDIQGIKLVVSMHEEDSVERFYVTASQRVVETVAMTEETTAVESPTR